MLIEDYFQQIQYDRFAVGWVEARNPKAETYYRLEAIVLVEEIRFEVRSDRLSQLEPIVLIAWPSQHFVAIAKFLMSRYGIPGYKVTNCLYRL